MEYVIDVHPIGEQGKDESLIYTARVSLESLPMVKSLRAKVDALSQQRLNLSDPFATVGQNYRISMVFEHLERYVQSPAMRIAYEGHEFSPLDRVLDQSNLRSVLPSDQAEIPSYWYPFNKHNL